MSDALFNEYARVFAQFTTQYQEEIYEKIVPRLRGHVLDAGAGCGKLAAYIPEESQMQSYLGVDSSAKMVELGQSLLSTLDRSDIQLQKCWIEDTQGSFDTIVSIQSYYAWNDSARVLSHLYEIMTEGGELHLATANNMLDIEFLIRQCSRGFCLHPDWSTYVEYNRMLSALPQGRFVSLDTLIDEIKQAGFCITGTNTSLFERGVNLVSAVKLEM
jgi:cyclopropane fatty-acyl-phospholipid synthase-like methyltransferase